MSRKGPGLCRGSMDGSMDREENKRSSGGSREGRRQNQKRESKERVAWTTVVGVSFIDRSHLLFVVEVVERSDTVNVTTTSSGDRLEHQHLHPVRQCPDVHGLGVGIRAADNIVQGDSVRSGLCHFISEDVLELGLLP